MDQLTPDLTLENTAQGMRSSYSNDRNFVGRNTTLPLALSTDSSMRVQASEHKATVSIITHARNISNNVDDLKTATTEGTYPERLLMVEQIKTEGILQLFPFVCGICSLQFNRIDKFYTHFESHSELTDEYFHVCMAKTDLDSYSEHLSTEKSEDSINANNIMYQCKLCGKIFLTVCQLHDHIINEEKVNQYVYDEASKSVDKCHSPVNNLCFGRNQKESLPENEKALKMTSMFEISKENNIKTIKSSQHHKKSRISKSTKSDNEIGRYDLMKDLERFYKTADVRYKLNVRGQTVNDNVVVGLEKCIEENCSHTLEDCMEGNNPDTCDDNMDLDDNIRVEDYIKKSDIKLLAEKERLTLLQKCKQAESEVMVSYDKDDCMTYLMASHVQTRDYKCNICRKAFKTNNTLLKHEKIHRTENNFVCQQCGKTFKTREYLNNHTRFHADVKDFPCPKCGKSFITISILKTHIIQTHTAVRDLPCHICEKTFKTQANLKQHMLTHTAVKDIPCPMCPKMFNSKAILKAHMVRHSDERPFVCDTCGRAFKRVDQLTNHRYMHTELRNHVCSTCGKAFIKKLQLIKHQKIHQSHLQQC